MIASKRRLTLAFGFGLPTELSKEAVMQVGTAIVVRIGAVVTDRTPEQLATLPPHPLPTRNREPLAFGSTAATLLTGSPGIDLDRDNPLFIRLLLRVLIDLAAQLIGTPAVHASGLACALGLDLAEPLKEQDAPRIAGTDLGNAVTHLVGGGLVHVPDVSPEILVALFPFDRFARLPLFLRHWPQVAIALLIESMIGEKTALKDDAMVPDGDHRQVLDIQIHCHGHQISITFALHHLFRLYRLPLGKVDRCPCFGEHEFGRKGLPIGFGAPLFKVAAVASGIVDPLPIKASVDAQTHKTVAQIYTLQLERAGTFVEGGMIAWGGRARLALLLSGSPAWVAFALR